MSSDRYRIESLIARGGMAEVFRALDRAVAPPRHVALKRMLPSLAGDPSLARLFEDEARIASRLAHPNVVAVLDVGVHEGRPFQVLELVDGPDASRVLEQRTFPPELALWICAEVAAALAHAHGATGETGEPLGIVHRDVSPSNVLLSRDGRVKLGDFGIALGADRRERTATGTTKGKAAYMSPEQTLGAKVDGRADVFGLGCTLHALITGKSPLADPDAMAGLLAGEPAPLSAALPESVRAIVAKAIAPRAVGRFATMAAMEEACRRALDAAPIDLAAWLAAEAPSLVAHPEPLAQLPSRSRWRWAAPAALAVIGLVGSSLLAFGDREESIDTGAIHVSDADADAAVSEPDASDAHASEPDAGDADASDADAGSADAATASRVDSGAPRRSIAAVLEPHLEVPSDPLPEPARWGVVNFRLPRGARVTLDGGTTPFRDARRGHACDTTGLCHLPVGLHRLLVTAPDGSREVSALCVIEGVTLQAFAPLPETLGCD